MWKKIAKWEATIKTAPKPALARIVTLFFAASVVLGAGISWGIDYFQARAYEGIEKDIRTTEMKRMDGRLEELEKLRLGLEQQ